MSEVSTVMSDVALLREASRLLRRLALPAVPGESVKSCQRRVHRHLRTWSFNRVRDLWRPDPRARVRAHEFEELRMAAQKSCVEDSARAARAELRELQRRVERLERLLDATDPEMYGPSIVAARDQARLALRAMGARARP